MKKSESDEWENNPQLIDPWVKVSSEHGDIYRQFLINPIIYELLRTDVEESSVSPIQAALTKWMVERDTAKVGQDWYEEWRQTELDKRLKILDLGCGEAYRGRWLSRDGVTYVGVDKSNDLLKCAREGSAFRVLRADLDEKGALRKATQELFKEEPPDWVFAITLLDHLQYPDHLLTDIANLYNHLDKKGHMLAVTCNPEFYANAAQENQPTKVRIASIDGDGGLVTVYLRSPRQFRQLFRDAGLRILDEFSLQLPSAYAKQRQFDIKGFNMAFPPLNFWLLEMHSTKRHYVERSEIDQWLQHLKEHPNQYQATQLLLEASAQFSNDLSWRILPDGAVIAGKHNTGGRVFVVKDGVFQLDAIKPRAVDSGSSMTGPRWRFNSGHLFGELELFRKDELEQFYTGSVAAKRHGSKSQSKVLEVPFGVISHLIEDDGPLSNPFFELLRTRVIEGLFRFDERVIEHDIYPKTLQHELKKMGFNNNEWKNLDGRIVVIVASLILQGLVREHYQSMSRPNSRQMITISSIRNAVTEINGKNVKPHPINVAIKFLAYSHVIRRARGTVSENAEKIGKPRLADDIQRLVKISTALKSSIEEASWAASLPLTNKKVLDCLIHLQNDCFFVIDDELSLRRCVLEPTVELFKMLAERQRFFFEQPLDIQNALDEDLVDVISRSLEFRFDDNASVRDNHINKELQADAPCLYDSLGWRII